MKPLHPHKQRYSIKVPGYNGTEGQTLRIPFSANRTVAELIEEIKRRAVLRRLLQERDTIELHLSDDGETLLCEEDQLDDAVDPTEADKLSVVVSWPVKTETVDLTTPPRELKKEKSAEPFHGEEDAEAGVIEEPSAALEAGEVRDHGHARVEYEREEGTNNRHTQRLHITDGHDTDIQSSSDGSEDSDTDIDDWIVADSSGEEEDEVVDDEEYEYSVSPAEMEELRRSSARLAAKQTFEGRCETMLRHCADAVWRYAILRDVLAHHVVKNVWEVGDEREFDIVNRFLQKYEDGNLVPPETLFGNGVGPKRRKVELHKIAVAFLKDHHGMRAAYDEEAMEDG